MLTGAGQTDQTQAFLRNVNNLKSHQLMMYIVKDLFTLFQEATFLEYLVKLSTAGASSIARN